MTRRKCAEGFVSNKKARKQTKLNEKRKENTRTEREAVIIACEDSVSAPLYFKNLFHDLITNHAIAASSLVIVKHGHTDPYGVLQDMLQYDDYKDFTHKWIVIDRDEERTNGGGHPLENFNRAIAEASKKKINVAYSNPCFEIWYLLHFEYRNTPIDRDELYRKLVEELGYSKDNLPDLIPAQQSSAIKYAKNLIESWVSMQGETKPASDNPSTTVHELVEVLNGLKTI